MSSELIERRKQEKIMCRFCLDDRQNKKNPFLSPCDCKGSIEFIHLYCLNRWRNQNLQPQNYELCNLCHTKYKIPSEYSLEEIPPRALVFLILDYPIFTNLSLHYVWGVCIGVFGKSTPQYASSYLTLQLVYNAYYILSMVFNFKIMKHERYIQAWKREARYLFFPFYGFMLLLSYTADVPFSWFTMNIVLSMFWHMHLHILNEMNSEDFQQIHPEHE